MKFCIQVCNPRLVDTTSADELSLDDAIESIFPLYSENAIMVWNNLFIPLSYKYDLSLMIIDVMNMLNSLILRNEGYLTIHWPSNTFRSNWNLNWSQDKLRINSEWESVVGNIEDKLNSVASLELDKYMFVREWKGLLNMILKSLNESGYTESKISEIAKLQEIVKKIDGSGLLYS